MEPRSSKTFDQTTFDRHLNRIKEFSSAKRERLADPAYSTPIPSEISLQLTYACNLRCKMCYQWNDDGYFNAYSQKDIKKQIDVDLFQKILLESQPAKSNLYLWGGEPLFHPDFESIAKALETDRRYTTMCTNGLLIEKQMDSLLRISPDLGLLVSIDGLGETNNNMRGKNTFNRVVKQLEMIFHEQKKGRYKGTVSINAVISDELAPQIVEFMEFFEALNVDSVYFNYPWYISGKRAVEMDRFYEDHLSWLGNEESESRMSWHSFTYRLGEQSIPVVREQARLLKNKVWKSRIRFQQHIENEHLPAFIEDTYSPKRTCFAWSNRMEIMADGRAGICCKFFPELSVGDIKRQGLLSVWKSPEFDRLRRILNRGLMPVCSKCILLYRNGV